MSIICLSLSVKFHYVMIWCATYRTNAAPLRTLNTCCNMTTWDESSISICPITNFTHLITCLCLISLRIEITTILVLLIINLHFRTRRIKICSLIITNHILVTIYNYTRLSLSLNSSINYRHILEIMDVRTLNLEHSTAYFQIVSNLNLLKLTLFPLCT